MLLIEDWSASVRRIDRYYAAQEAKWSVKNKLRAYFAKLNADERYWK